MKTENNVQLQLRRSVTMILTRVLALLLLFTLTAEGETKKYRDGRPAATLRMDAKDHGIVLRHGDGPGKCDILGARDAWVFEAGVSPVL